MPLFYPIDANRNARVLSQVAYHPNCITARNAYDDYHNSIEDCISHSISSSSFSRALLLDIHGMSPYTDSIIVGTLNGQTCATSGK